MMNSPFYELSLPIYTGNILVTIHEEPWLALKTAGLPLSGFKRKQAAQCYAWVDQFDNDVFYNGKKIRWGMSINLSRIGGDESLMMDTLAHECYHLTNYIAEWFGLSKEAGDDEAPAYIHGFLVKEIWKFVQEAKSGALF